MDDVQKAKRFYGQTLGLEVSEAHGLLELHIAGGIRIVVTRSPTMFRRRSQSSTFPWTTSKER